MEGCKYPHRITINMTNKLHESLKQHLSLQYAMEDLTNPADLIMLYAVAALDKNETLIFLKTSDLKLKEKI